MSVSPKQVKRQKHLSEIVLCCTFIAEAPGTQVRQNGVESSNDIMMCEEVEKVVRQQSVDVNAQSLLRSQC